MRACFVINDSLIYISLSVYDNMLLTEKIKLIIIYYEMIKFPSFFVG